MFYSFPVVLLRYFFTPSPMFISTPSEHVDPALERSRDQILAWDVSNPTSHEFVLRSEFLRDFRMNHAGPDWAVTANKRFAPRAYHSDYLSPLSE